MRVTVHPADLGGCGAYRMTWPGEALAAQGYDVRLAYDESYNMQWRNSSIQGARVESVFNTPDADVIVLQRPLTRNRVEMMGAMQAAGIAVVVEVDDDFHAIHAKNPAWTGTNPLNDPDRNRDWLMKACRRADLVTVSTPALARRYGEHGRVAILPNYVPERYTTLNPPAETFRVGWSGSTLTHPRDLEVVGDAIARLGCGFHVIGTGYGATDYQGFHIPSPAEALGLDETTATGWVELNDYPQALQALEVGIVPLALTNFNEAKSWLKGLEYASVGVPFVASPTQQYRELAENGIGWIAESPDDWYRLVGEMVNDDEHRNALATAWRGEIAARYTIEAHAHRWWDAWGQALENASRREKVA